MFVCWNKNGGLCCGTRWTLSILNQVYWPLQTWRYLEILRSFVWRRPFVCSLVINPALSIAALAMVGRRHELWAQAQSLGLMIRLNVDDIEIGPDWSLVHFLSTGLDIMQKNLALTWANKDWMHWVWAIIMCGNIMKLGVALKAGKPPMFQALSRFSRYFMSCWMHANGKPAGNFHCFHSCSILGISYPWLPDGRPNRFIPWHRGWGSIADHNMWFDTWKDCSQLAVGNLRFEIQKCPSWIPLIMPHDSWCIVYITYKDTLTSIIVSCEAFLFLANSFRSNSPRCIGFQPFSAPFSMFRA